MSLCSASFIFCFYVFQDDRKHVSCVVSLFLLSQVRIVVKAASVKGIFFFKSVNGIFRVISLLKVLSNIQTNLSLLTKKIFVLDIVYNCYHLNNLQIFFVTHYNNVRFFTFI